MPSSISRFKYPVLLAALIVTTELLLRHYQPEQGTRYTNGLFNFSYRQTESFFNYIVDRKMTVIAKEKKEVFTFGDSSGLYGIQPSFFREKGEVYLANMNLSLSFGYHSYIDLARYLADRNPAMKYVLLAVSPAVAAEPLENYPEEGRQLKHYYMSFGSRLKLPSLAWRGRITNFVYYDQWKDTPYGYEASDGTFFTGAAIDRDLIPSGGWLPYPDFRSLSEEPLCGYPVPSRSADNFLAYLEKMAEVAKKKHLRFGIAFSPVRCREYGPGTDELQIRLDRFAVSHPEVFIPWDYIFSMDPEKFMDWFHLDAVKGSPEYSALLAEAVDRWRQGETRNHFRFEGETRGGGLWTGKVTSLYPSGQIKSERNYAEGRAHGDFLTYTPEGKLQSRRHYVRGRLEGRAVFFFPDGSIHEDEFPSAA